MSVLLESRNLNKTFFPGRENEHHVLKNVSLTINKGEFLSVMGPSGSGKSTLLYNISGMDRPCSGRIVFDGQDISSLPEKKLSELRLTRMGFVFQHIHLLKNLNLFDNIIMSAYLARKKSRAAVNKKAEELMKGMGITSLAGNDIFQASGGQLQRVGICRALINEPEIIFGDEPTGALNSKASGEIMELLTDINREGTTVMLVTHDIRVAARTGRVVFMLDGTIVDELVLGEFTGSSADIREREERLTAWLVERGF